MAQQLHKHNRIFDRDNPVRSIVFSDYVDESTVQEAIQFIFDINEYDDENEDSVNHYERKPIKFIINSFGGSIYDGFGLIGAIETSKTPVYTYCYGSAMSMALLILASGHKRFGYRLSTFMYHECSDSIPDDKLSIIVENIEEVKRLMKTYDDYLISKTGFKRKQLDEVKKAKYDWYFGAEEALKYGLVDEII
jgi:ATP-dependent Clp protease protease subunit